MNHLRDLILAALAGVAAAAVAEALGAYGERLTMPDGAVVHARLTAADEVALLGGAP